MFNCKYCNKEDKLKKNTYNLYCNVKCFGLFKFYNDTIPRVEKGSVESPTTLKKYLIEKFGEICSCCGIKNSWNNKPLSLQLEHKDGNSDNNLPENLCLLCPNCHSQTDTFAGKKQNKKSTKRNSYLRKYKGYDGQVV